MTCYHVALWRRWSDTKVITRYNRVKLFADPVRESAPAMNDGEGNA